MSGTAQKCLWYALRGTPRSTRAPAQGTPPPSTAEQRPLRTNPWRPVPWSAAGARSSPRPGCCGERAMDAGQTPPWTAGETRSGRWGRQVAGRLHLHLSKELRAVSCGGCTHTNKCIKDGKQKARARKDASFHVLRKVQRGRCPRPASLRRSGLGHRFRAFGTRGCSLSVLSVPLPAPRFLGVCRLSAGFPWRGPRSADQALPPLPQAGRSCCRQLGSKQQNLIWRGLRLWKSHEFSCVT